MKIQKGKLKELKKFGFESIKPEDLTIHHDYILVRTHEETSEKFPFGSRVLIRKDRSVVYIRKEDIKDLIEAGLIE